MNLELSRSGNSVRNGFRRPDGRGSGQFAESALELGLDPGCLGPADVLRCDLVATLRATIDRTSAELLAGGGTVSLLGVHTSAIEQLRKLLPEHKLAPPPEHHHDDPRQAMWEIYKTMRERGELSLREIPDEGLMQAKINEQAAEIERLKAQLVGGLAPVPPDVPMLVESVPAPAGANVVPLPRPNPPAASAAPRYDYNVERSWRDHVLPDGSISPTPMSRTRWWGPV
jgi:uncharacterized small protein (DUF1192 family)